MVEYSTKLSSLGAGQLLTEDKILNILGFLLLKEWQKELIIQGFDPATQGISELVKFCEHLETAEKIFRRRVKEMNKTKQKLISPVNATDPPSWRRAKGYTRRQNPWKRY